MTALVHSYQMIARAGSESALAEALEALAESVKGIAGSQGAMVLRDRKEAQKFLFLEFWEDEASRKAAGSQLPKEVMGRIMAALGGPLQMADWDRLAG
jgi:quinol monooxygenase YgiN